MIRKFCFVFAVVLSFALAVAGCSARVEMQNRIDKLTEDGPYKAEWKSLQKHPVPEWFRDAKFGIYTHWGVYSVPAFGNEWYPHWMYINRAHRVRGNYYQFHKKNFADPLEFGYRNFVPMFKAEKFDADKWAELFEKAGAKFAGPVAEHHDGFAMWDSALTKWDSKEKGPKRDIVGELEKAIRKRGMKFITSFHHARKWQYYEASYKLGEKVDTRDKRFAGIGKIYPPVHEAGQAPTPQYMQEWLGKIVEVTDKYQPDLLWFDGGLDREQFWRGARQDFQHYKKQMLAYYYNKAHQSPQQVAVTYKHTDLPRGAGILDIERGRMDKVKDFVWLTDTSVDMKSWCYVKNPQYKSVNALVDVLVDIVSKNGCMLLNIGPKPDGTIPKDAERLLLGIGQWLKINGEAIYGTRPCAKYQQGGTEPGGEKVEEKREGSYGSSDIRFTKKGNKLYAIVLGWPGESVLIKSIKSDAYLPGDIKSIRLLGHQGELRWRWELGGLRIQMPYSKPCEHAFAVKITTAKKTEHSKIIYKLFLQEVTQWTGEHL